MLPVTVAWSSWRQYNTLRSLLSVLWMTSYFYIMERKGQNQIRRMNGQGRERGERGYAGPTRVFSDCRRIRCVLRFCGWRHIFIQWSEWARIKDHARISSSSPGGGNGGGRSLPSATACCFVVVSIQDENARYYTYRFIDDQDEAMSYWVDSVQHSTVFYSHYRKATVRLGNSTSFPQRDGKYVAATVAFISQPQSNIALWPLLIFRPAHARRLSWPVTIYPHGRIAWLCDMHVQWVSRNSCC